jgi:hypothetical protein
MYHKITCIESSVASILCNSGSKNANVLPEPVCACIITSLDLSSNSVNAAACVLCQ